MFCPGCGIEDHSANQFCRSWGADLRTVRTAIASPDQVTASAVTARDEIGRAVAAKIRDLRGEAELSTFAEEVLPEIEKFLESPAEKRLRRMRTGIILSSIGLGAAVGISFAGVVMQEEGIMFLAGLGVVAFFLGLGFVLNGVLLTVPKADGSPGPGRQQTLDGGTNDLQLPAVSAQEFSSVTEHTTKHLHERARK